MFKATAIKLVNPTAFMVTWDVLRRCNLDCSYCESTRHNNYSPYPTLKDLKNTFDFIKKYSDLYNEKRQYNSFTSIDFTGGEPTANPNFWPLIDYIKSQGEYRLGLTTNGTWGPAFTNRILNNFVHVTISWHAEAEIKLKNRTIKNIIALHEKGMSVQANIMLHTDHFNEAVEVYDLLKNKGIQRVNPVPIGDGNLVRKGWFIDSDGKNRRTSHEYSKEQQDWFYRTMGLNDKVTDTKEGTNVGRTCCGSRCIQAKANGNNWQDAKLIDNWFEGWHCMVNWFFMHVDQHTGNIYHHQTCQATFSGRGPIGNIQDKETVLKDLQTFLNQDQVSSIVCPNKRCGCGMCVPKAESFDDFQKLWSDSVNIKLKQI